MTQSVSLSKEFLSQELILVSKTDCAHYHILVKTIKLS